ncbi:hypothetical protein B0H13DRAFT_1853502 [Mycena leptocephala]|nr:hypothetical protein B0H13DRAFT_1853502 [Mycena leptocephala]
MILKIIEGVLEDPEAVRASELDEPSEFRESRKINTQNSYKELIPNNATFNSSSPGSSSESDSTMGKLISEVSANSARTACADGAKGRRNFKGQTDRGKDPISEKAIFSLQQGVRDPRILASVPTTTHPQKRKVFGWDKHRRSTACTIVWRIDPVRTVHSPPVHNAHIADAPSWDASRDSRAKDKSASRTLLKVHHDARVD